MTSSRAGTSAAEQELEDANTWQGIELSPPPVADAITAGPYSGFRLGQAGGVPDPARAAECARDAERWNRQDARRASRNAEDRRQLPIFREVHK